VCRPISPCNSPLGQPAPDHAAAADKLAAHQLSAECLLTELCGSAALRERADSAHRKRQSSVCPALARRVPPLLGWRLRHASAATGNAGRPVATGAVTILTVASAVLEAYLMRGARRGKASAASAQRRRRKLCRRYASVITLITWCKLHRLCRHHVMSYICTSNDYGCIVSSEWPSCPDKAVRATFASSMHDVFTNTEQGISCKHRSNTTAYAYEACTCMCKH